MRCRDRAPASRQRRSDRLSKIADVASPRPVPTAPSLLSEVAPPLCSNPTAVRPSDAVASFVHGERRPSSPLVVLRPWSVELTSPSLLPVTGPPPATIAPPRRKNAAAASVFSPSPSTRSSGELFSPSPCRTGSLTVVVAQPPPFVPPPPLWHRRRPRRDAHPESGDHSGVRPRCAAPSRAAQAEAGPASAGRALHTGAVPAP
jgi:hypothetical protein